MRQKEQRPPPATVGGKEISLVETDRGFSWRWNSITHAVHEFLEIRPWTPIAISNDLCFVARDDELWSVTWGREVLVEADDCLDTDEWQGLPVFIHRTGQSWAVQVYGCVVHRASTQLTYRIMNGRILVYDFPIRPSAAPLAVVTSADKARLLRESRPCADPGREAIARVWFDDGQCPEEWVARNHHRIGCCSLGTIRYSDPELDDWIQRVTALLKNPAQLTELRRRHLTSDEITELQDEHGIS